MPKLILAFAAAAMTSVTACSFRDGPRATAGDQDEVSVQVVSTSDVQWEPLNPARGDKGPKAGALWGDRTGAGPSGFLVKFADGFSSPPHIHNVSYRGLVVGGLIHNDDPHADEMWMPAGSFWTQPKGAVHITAAKGSHNLAYIEIGEGPYLVLPVDEEFQSGEKPRNVDASNLVWVHQPAAGGSQVAFLWGNPQDGRLNGTLVKLPAGFTGTLRSHGATFRAVVIQGRPEHQVPGRTDVKAMEPGSYFRSEGRGVHQLSCEAGEECVVYVRMEGTLDVMAAPPEK